MNIKSKAKTVGTVILALIILIIMGYQCPLLYATGIPCLACGMTRAYMSLLRFDIRGAFYYHPLFFLIPIIGLVMLFPEKIPSKTRKKLYGGFIAIFVVVYFYRLFFTSSDVVYIDFWNSYIGRILSMLQGSRGVIGLITF